MTLSSDPGNSSEDVDFDPVADYNSFLPALFQCGRTVQVEDPYYQPTNSTVCVIASKVSVEICGTASNQQVS